ncbi:MAG: VWA domain-containing protein [Pseudomonadota bacterium]
MQLSLVPSMKETRPSASEGLAALEAFRWHLALRAIEVFARLQRDPVQRKHAVMVVKASAGPVRDAFRGLLEDALAGTSLHTLPVSISSERLLGGLDLTATLATGSKVFQPGLLHTAHGGVLFVPMAEGLSEAVSVQLTRALDHGSCDPGMAQVARDSHSANAAARFGLVLFDESGDGAGSADGGADGYGVEVDAAILDRAAIHVDLRGVSIRAFMAEGGDSFPSTPDRTGVDDPHAEAVALALAFGLTSLRVPLQLLAVARALAGQRGEDLQRCDLETAVHLSLLVRAQAMPAQEEEQAVEEPQASDPPEPLDPPEPDERDFELEAADMEANDDTASQPTDAPPDEMTVESVLSNLPAGLLAALQSHVNHRQPTKTSGRRGQRRSGGERGRPLGARRGALRQGKRVDLLATLRSAAPWQKARKQRVPEQQAKRGPEQDGRGHRLRVLPSDIHVKRFKDVVGRTTIFVVDASGSTALNRLAETKGAVELLLADSYARRDHVGLIAFRGRAAQVLLEPTRSLVRAKRSLATLPGGGGTPLAAGLDAAHRMVLEESRKGRAPTLVLLTDGSANVGLDGLGGRAKAMEDALTMGSALAQSGVASVLVDVSRQPSQRSQQLADSMTARYVPMPLANAQALSAVVRGGTAATRAPNLAVG